MCSQIYEYSYDYKSVQFVRVWIYLSSQVYRYIYMWAKDCVMSEKCAIIINFIVTFHLLFCLFTLFFYFILYMIYFLRARPTFAHCILAMIVSWRHTFIRTLTRWRLYTRVFRVTRGSSAEWFSPIVVTFPRKPRGTIENIEESWFFLFLQITTAVTTIIF